MSIKLVNQNGLKRDFSVTILKNSIIAKKTARLAEIAKKAKIQGFRPGKIPAPIIEQRFGDEAFSHALDSLIQSSISELYETQKIRPAMQPKVELADANAVQDTADIKDIEIKVSLEILPSVTVNDFSKISIEKPVAEVASDKIDDAISKIAKRMRKPEPVKDNRTAVMGDILVIDFDGSVNGEKHEGMKAENHRLELGTKSFIDTFEDQLVGTKAGDKKSVKVKFPDKYHAPDLEGKDAVFEVSVKKILEHAPVELNDALGKELGFPSIDKLREKISDDMKADYNRMSRLVAKRSLMDELAKEYVFDIPECLLNSEFSGIWRQVEESMKNNSLPAEDTGKSEKELRKEYTDIADRRIRLGLLLAEVARQNKIEVTPEELRSVLMNEVRRFPGQEQRVIDYYTKTQGALERLKTPALEEKVIDFILEKVDLKNKTVSFDELVKLTEEEN
ncbi:MAG: trigger factor [Alphaproteobacteria bacterium]|nr:trigger factor [Alphaproteobacteria bacterium]MCL2505208.1 trigger factor [Alphaproteobacteria bacterium]